MGRPLSKKYFGNRNIGTTGTGDNYGIGGEGLASISTATQGTINIGDTASDRDFPVLTIGAPNLPTGVQATATPVWEIKTISVYGAGNDYTNSQTGASAVLVGSVTDDASVAPVITIDTNGSHGVSAISVAGGRGEWTGIDGTGISTWAITGAGGTTGQATVTFRLKRIDIVEKGSGYTAVPALSWATNTGTVPTGQTPALTTDSGAVGSSTNQENAIQISAYIPVANGGSSAVAGDIVKQEGSRRYKVITAQGTGVVKLVATAPAAGQARITATDSAGGTYYVTKLTAHKALVTRGTGTQFATGASVKWTFDAPTANESVTITNA